jgi:hypothetical protein
VVEKIRIYHRDYRRQRLSCMQQSCEIKSLRWYTRKKKFLLICVSNSVTFARTNVVLTFSMWVQLAWVGFRHAGAWILHADCNFETRENGSETLWQTRVWFQHTQVWYVHAKCHVDTHKCDFELKSVIQTHFHINKCDFDTQNITCIHTMSMNLIRKMWFPHKECDFEELLFEF